MAVIIDMKTQSVINKSLKQSRLAAGFDITITLLRIAFIVCFLAFRFNLI